MLPKSKQATDHIGLIEPAVFYANPETMESNAYQNITDETREEVYNKALAEFKAFRKMLTDNGVKVTTFKGIDGCPDHIFPNWVSTHTTQKGQGMVLYPMLNENRRLERTPDMVNALKKDYDLLLDMTEYEEQDRCLEANGSLCLDRVNKVAYAALSSRTDPDLAELWAQKTGYDLEFFNTEGPGGKPVYHTDLVMWIGDGVAAICSEALSVAYRQQITDRLRKTHEVIGLSLDQMNHFCGNALEVTSKDRGRLLVMSSSAYSTLAKAQKDTLKKHYDKIIHCPIPTIEQHGGGSARCLMLELF